MTPAAISLDRRVSEDDDACTFGELISDTWHPGPEEIWLQREALQEAMESQKHKVLSEVSALSARPAELLVRIACVHLQLKQMCIRDRLASCRIAYKIVRFSLF